MKTPVAIFAFNRPQTTERVYASVAAARPPILFTVCDGPREAHPQDKADCDATRSIIARVDWPADVHTRWSDVNLGCAESVASGLDWVFSQVDRAIILEDDFVPHPSFFRFCDELLDRYADDDRVMMITGSNHLGVYRRRNPSYGFSQHFTVGAWATWRRAWRHYDHSMASWPAARASGLLHSLITIPGWADHLTSELDAVAEGRLNSWAYRWTLACLMKQGLQAVPWRNLATNIGYTGLHTASRSAWHDRPAYDIGRRIQHPGEVVADHEFDRLLAVAHLSGGLIPDRDPAYWTAHGWRAYEAGDYASALRLYLRAAALRPAIISEVAFLRLLGSTIKRGIRERLTGRPY